MQDRMTLRRALDQLRPLQEYRSLQGLAVLDIGSGLGDFALAAHKAGATSFAVDTATELVEFSSWWFATLGERVHLSVASGEALPFADSTLDAVFCNFVLEHSCRPSLLVQEAARVLKPEGLLYINAPNYSFPYEAHYNLFGVPLLPRTIAKFYLAMRGRDPAALDGIRYVTYAWICGTLRQCGFRIARDLVQVMVDNPDTIHSVVWRRAAEMVGRLHMPSAIISQFAPVVSLIAAKGTHCDPVQGPSPSRSGSDNHAFCTRASAPRGRQPSKVTVPRGE